MCRELRTYVEQGDVVWPVVPPSLFRASPTTPEVPTSRPEGLWLGCTGVHCTYVHVVHTYGHTYICTYALTRSTVCTHVWHQLPFRDPLHGHAQHLTNECSSKQWRVCSRTLAVSRCLQLLFLLLNVVRKAARCLGLSTCRDKGGASAVAGVFKVRTYVCTYVVSMQLTNACVCVCVCACVRAYACMMVWLSSLVLPAYLCKQTTFTFVIRPHVDTQM